MNDGSYNFLRIAANTGDRQTCVVCGRPVSGTFRADRYGTVACLNHPVESCCGCGRLIPGRAVAIPHFGGACPKCASVRTYAELETVRAFVYEFYTKRRLYVPAFSLKLVSPDEMHRRFASPNGSTPRGVAVKEGERYTINIMQQQSRIGIAQTLAHELAHLWQWHRGIDAPHTYCEGFCNLAAFLVISEINKGEALVRLHQMMEDPDPAYGSAFRELKVVYDVHGWDTVIASMKKFV